MKYNQLLSAAIVRGRDGWDHIGNSISHHDEGERGRESEE